MANGGVQTLNAVSSEAAKADALVDHEYHNCQIASA